MVNGWTRDDLPTTREAIVAYLQRKGPFEPDALSLTGIDNILDTVIEHLNDHHPKRDEMRRERDAAVARHALGQEDKR